MKKGFLLISSLVSILSFGQHICGFEAKQKELDKKFPENKARREKINQEFREKGTFGILKEYGFANDKQNNIFSNTISSNYQGEIYEIPVVVHVIESNHPDDAGVKLTDEQIKTWIDNANKMYATTYGNGFFPEGDGFENGAVIPFKLVLAKRTPECQPTNGIIRYDATNVANYSKNGLANGAEGTRKGANGADIKALAPHWPETSYYNIYVVIGFDGNKAGYGLMGWATGPDANFSDYETMMKAAVVTKNNDATLAHEFGHSLGLAHPFHGVDYNSGLCPVNNDCSVDNDGVCDTEPTKSLINVATPTNNDINPCTNKNYEGVQYNIMNYTFQPRKFTPGQRDRALALFLSQKGVLVNSLGATSLDQKPAKTIDLTPPSCSIAGIDQVNNYDIGITGVEIGDISNQSDPSLGTKFYNDYATNHCSLENYTDIQDGIETTLTLHKRGTNGFPLLAWIDYNDNGIFEASELLFNQNVGNGVTSYTHTFTPPADAVKNKYIRMRVKGDWWGTNLTKPCGNLKWGDVEDYAIRIITPDFVDPDDPNNNPNDPNNPNSDYDGGLGRVGINTEEPRATLDVREVGLDLLPTGTAQGVSFPNFTTEQRNTFKNVKEGTMIYNITLHCLEIYTGTSWKCFQ